MKPDKILAVVFLLGLVFLPHFAKRLQSRGHRQPAVANEALVQEQIQAERIALLMTLDLLVRVQKAIKEESGSYSKYLGQIPDITGSIGFLFQINIEEASGDRLQITARRDPRRNMESRPRDFAAIDEWFQLHTNFEIPVMPRDYLLSIARTVIGQMMDGNFQSPLEGVFKGYFQYEKRPTSDGKHAIIATGIKAPVSGHVVTAGDSDLFLYVYQYRKTQLAWAESRYQLEKIYLAQKLHQNTTGRFSGTLRTLVPYWNGLESLDPAGGEPPPFLLQELHLDPSLGFYAEVSAQSSSQELNSDILPDQKTWSINGYGQTSEISSIEALIQQFENTKRRIAGKRDARKNLLIEMIEEEK